MENIEIFQTYLGEDFPNNRYRIVIKFKDKVVFYFVDRKRETMYINPFLYPKLWIFKALKHFKENLSNSDITEIELR